MSPSKGIRVKTSSMVSGRMVSGVDEGATAMTMDADSSVFMMDMLGKLYARPAQAALREYLSNAYDAHKAKGGELPPIQVHLPRASDVKFIMSIRDFGNGMSEEEFKTVLSRYGKSTKRDSNALIGGFGLGAKAGFALGDEFFMTSYQNGSGLRVRLFKDVSNQGYVEVVERFSTNEPDGMLVEVAVPKGNLNELTEDGLNFLLLSHDPETIQVTPALTKKTLSVHDTTKFDPLELNGNIVGWMGGTTVSSRHDTLFVVVGKIVYLLSLKELAHASDDDAFKKFCEFSLKFLRCRVINLPIGSVDLPSSREEIILSDRSLKAIAGACNTYQHVSYAAFQNEINKDSYQQAMLLVSILKNAAYAQVDSLSWRGKKLGLPLLESSNAVLHHFTPNPLSHKNSLPEETHQVSEMIDLDDFIHMSIVLRNTTNLAVITVDDDTDMSKIRENLAINELSDQLVNLLCKKTKKASNNCCFLFMSETDPLYAMFKGKGVETIEFSLFNMMVAHVKEDKAREAEEQEEKRLQELARGEARKAEMAKLVTSFVPVRNHRHYFPLAMTPEATFDLPYEKVYYWSQEEIQQLGNTEAEAFLFPFKYNKDQNTYKTSGKEEIGFTNGYIHSLYSLLNFFLPENARARTNQDNRLVIVGEHMNLETFNAEYPEVESGVTKLLSAIKSQTEQEGSDLTVLLELLDENYKTSREVTTVMNQLLREMDETHAAKVNDKFLTQMNKIQRTKKIANEKGYFTESYLHKVIPMFGCDIPPVVGAWQEHALLRATYPLLFAAAGNIHGKILLDDAIDYINLKTK